MVALCLPEHSTEKHAPVFAILGPGNSTGENQHFHKVKLLLVATQTLKTNAHIF